MLEKELNFLVFWGKYSRNELLYIPKWKRKLLVEWTIENLKKLYGSED